MTYARSKWLLVCLTLASTLVAPTVFAEGTNAGDTYPAIQTKDQPRADQWIQSHNVRLMALENYVKETAPDKVLDTKIDSLNSLRRNMMAPHPNVDFRAHPDFEAERVRLMNLRTELARRGRYVGEWREWDFDGLTVGEEEKKFLLSFEDKFNGVHSAIGVSTQGDERLQKMRTILARKEFETNPTLKAYKEALGQHVLYGAIYRDALLRVRAMGNAYRSLKNDVDRNWSNCRGPCKTRVHDEAKSIIKMIDQVKSAGISLSEAKIKEDEREPLSDELDLNKVRAEAVKLSAK